MHDQWITNRLPTMEDADEDGEVMVKTARVQSPADGDFAHYSVVVPGQPWWSRKARFRQMIHAAPPAPAPTRVVTALASDAEFGTIAACNDGTIWNIGSGPEWTRLPSIPQSETSSD